MAAMPAHRTRHAAQLCKEKHTSGTQMIGALPFGARMAQDRCWKDVSCTELIGIAAMVAVEYRADQRTDSKSKQAHLIGAHSHRNHTAADSRARVWTD